MTPRSPKQITANFQKHNYESLIHQLQLENQLLKEKIGYENEVNMALQTMLQDLQEDHQKLSNENQELKTKLAQLNQ
ncbi:MAG TPA: hypothetical protein DCS93_01325 [Microscillaceae bacterium]|nr:hypothetical protein [Microscillaceae bacterium]